VVPSGLEELDTILGGGYPNRSTVLLVGPPGIGKEALGYWFATSSQQASDFRLYVTRLAVSEVKEDIGAFSRGQTSEPVWMADQGGQLKCDITDLARLSSTLKEALRKNATGKQVRIVCDILSSLLMLNPPETVYKFLTNLLPEVKGYDTVFLATLDEGMHQPQVLAAMEQLFDGVIELSVQVEGLKVRPLLRVKKMRGMAPQPGYFLFSFAGNRMEISTYVR
jgi:circadian clock protein KaiC